MGREVPTHYRVTGLVYYQNLDGTHSEDLLDGTVPSRGMLPEQFKRKLSSSIKGEYKDLLRDFNVEVIEA